LFYVRFKPSAKVFNNAAQGQKSSRKEIAAAFCLITLLK
jgi:hypothetical protein